MGSLLSHDDPNQMPQACEACFRFGETVTSSRMVSDYASLVSLAAQLLEIDMSRYMIQYQGRDIDSEAAFQREYKRERAEVIERRPQARFTADSILYRIEFVVVPESFTQAAARMKAEASAPSAPSASA